MKQPKIPAESAGNSGVEGPSRAVGRYGFLTGVALGLVVVVAIVNGCGSMGHRASSGDTAAAAAGDGGDALTIASDGTVTLDKAAVSGALTAGATTINGTLGAGATTLASAKVTDTLTAGATTVNGTLGAGATTLASAKVTGTLDAGATTLASANVTGTLSAGASTLTSAKVNGTLTATSTATLPDIVTDVVQLKNNQSPPQCTSSTAGTFFYQVVPNSYGRLIYCALFSGTTYKFMILPVQNPPASSLVPDREPETLLARDAAAPATEVEGLRRQLTDQAARIERLEAALCSLAPATCGVTARTASASPTLDPAPADPLLADSAVGRSLTADPPGDD